MSVAARRIALGLASVVWLVGPGCEESPPAGPSVTTTSASAPSGAAAPKTAPATPTGPPREISFDDVKFDMAVGAPFERRLLTPAIEATSGQRVRIRGYILPSFKQSGIEEFVLVRDNMQCCFGPGAALYDCIIVRMRPGKSTDYTVRPVSVTGVFKVDELKDEFSGKHLAIYSLDGEQVD